MLASASPPRHQHQVTVLQQHQLAMTHPQHQHALMTVQAVSPGPAYSDGGGGGGSQQHTPGSGGGRFSGLLGSLKKAMPHSPRAHSPTSSFGGSEMGTPPSRSKLGLPSYSNGQRKREIIKKLEDDVTALQMQLHQRNNQLGLLQQQAAQAVDAQERLNMQYFKCHLLVDMLVAQLLQQPQPQQAHATPTAAQPTAATVATAAAPAQQQPHKQGAAGAAVMTEDSFE